ncbi:MAG: hypothetical protein SFV24_21730 [Gemmatimonadales bacterium]|nr:hypothetical protein [Gemmatimonadales bacterium]
MGDAGFFALFLAVGGATLALFLGPIGQALGRRLTGVTKDPVTGLTTGEMAAERVGQLEQRVLELEERLDFAERMLANSTPAQLPESVDPVNTPV